jgi:hypothetical protein
MEQAEKAHLKDALSICRRMMASQSKSQAMARLIQEGDIEAHRFVDHDGTRCSGDGGGECPLG